MSKLKSGEQVASSAPRPLTRVTAEAKKIAAMVLDPTNISGVIFKDDSHSETCILGKDGGP